MTFDNEKVLDAAVEYLSKTSMRVLDKSWYHADLGTLPIVATERNTLVVVLPTAQPIPREMGRMLTLRMRRLAVAWMNAHGTRYDQVRIDYLRVTLLSHGQSNLEHVRGMG